MTKIALYLAYCASLVICIVILILSTDPLLRFVSLFQWGAVAIVIRYWVPRIGSEPIRTEQVVNRFRCRNAEERLVWWLTFHDTTDDRGPAFAEDKANEAVEQYRMWWRHR